MKQNRLRDEVPTVTLLGSGGVEIQTSSTPVVHEMGLPVGSADCGQFWGRRQKGSGGL